MRAISLPGYDHCVTHAGGGSWNDGGGTVIGIEGEAERSSR